MNTPHRYKSAPALLWQSRDFFNFFFCQPDVLLFSEACKQLRCLCHCSGSGWPTCSSEKSQQASVLPSITLRALGKLAACASAQRPSEEKQDTGAPLCSIPSSRSPPHSPQNSPARITGQHIQKTNSWVTWRQKGKSETLFRLPLRSQRRMRVIFDLTTKVLIKRWV